MPDGKLPYTILLGNYLGVLKEIPHPARGLFRAPRATPEKFREHLTCFGWALRMAR
jgi:hypothetical protein